MRGGVVAVAFVLELAACVGQSFVVELRDRRHWLVHRGLGLLEGILTDR